VGLKDLGEMHSEHFGLLFVASGPSSILLSDGRELYLRTFKPLGGFPQSDSLIQISLQKWASVGLPQFAEFSFFCEFIADHIFYCG